MAERARVSALSASGEARPERLVAFKGPPLTSVVVRRVAHGPRMAIYQACAPPEGPRLRIGARAALYHPDDAFTGVVGTVAAVRAPERDSVDLVLERTAEGEPVRILNVSLALDWAELPPWAREVHAAARDSLPSTYPPPELPPTAEPTVLPSTSSRAEPVTANRLCASLCHAVHCVNR